MGKVVNKKGGLRKGKKGGKNILVDPEAAMLKMAKSGKLMDAGKLAIEESLKAGISPIVMVGEHLIQLHPDGTQTILPEKDS